MAGQRFLITGGAGGIGSALARLLVERGDRVVLFGRRPEPLDLLAQELGNGSVAVPGDATNPADLENVVNRAVEHFGRLDGLAHCVGSIFLKPLHLTTPEDFSDTIEKNLLSAFLASRAVLVPLRKQGSGSIVLVSTVAARQGLSNHETIAAAKAGIEGLVRSAAISYARQGIRFNAVAPGLTETPLAAHLLSNDASRAFSEALHPLGRIGKPYDVASVIAHLFGSDANWVTGQIWGIDGGLGCGVSPAHVSTRS